ncbi:hypothetical protein AWB65_06330 [Caballeronia humi]|uniref:Uncharacterized protein n=1 Tax=Caballeronia humi TaxID=326474 RepID=A0A158JCZ8_9BURK|nr:hypothetical protein AWB65_06330 [Caballeronia humi]
MVRVSVQSSLMKIGLKGLHRKRGQSDPCAAAPLPHHAKPDVCGVAEDDVADPRVNQLVRTQAGCQLKVENEAQPLSGLERPTMLRRQVIGHMPGELPLLVMKRSYAYGSGYSCGACAHAGERVGNHVLLLDQPPEHA